MGGGSVVIQSETLTTRWPDRPTSAQDVGHYLLAIFYMETMEQSVRSLFGLQLGVYLTFLLAQLPTRGSINELFAKTLTITGKKAKDDTSSFKTMIDLREMGIAVGAGDDPHPLSFVKRLQLTHE